LSAYLARKQALTARLKHRLTDPRFLIADRQQYLDECFSRLARAQNKRLFSRRQRLELAHRGLLSRHPRAVLAHARASLGPLVERLQGSMYAALAEERRSFAEASARLQSLSPLSVLSRGYAIVTASDGRPVLSALEVARGDALDVRLGHGALRAVVSEIHSNESRRS
jgi:exodeoxyribonuclease VII large subunit